MTAAIASYWVAVSSFFFWDKYLYQKQENGINLRNCGLVNVLYNKVINVQTHHFMMLCLTFLVKALYINVIDILRGKHFWTKRSYLPLTLRPAGQLIELDCLI